MSGDFSDVVASVTPPKNATGKSISIDMTGDHCISSFTLGVQFDDAAGDKLLDAPVPISDGSLGTAINEEYDAAVVLAVADGETPTIPDPEDAEGPEIANPDYPVKPNAQQKWNAAQNALKNALAHEDVSTLPTLEERLAKVADLLVDLLLAAAESGTYPQKWGKMHLRACYYRAAATKAR